MSDTSQGPGWWLASDGKWYPPELWTGPPESGPQQGQPTGLTHAGEPGVSQAGVSAEPGQAGQPIQPEASSGQWSPGIPPYPQSPGDPGGDTPGPAGAAPGTPYGSAPPAYPGDPAPPPYSPYTQYPQYPPGGYGGAPAIGPKTNGLAIASLICSCAGVLLFSLPCILGVVFGFVARSQIRRSQGAQKGNGLALAGIIVGFAWIAIVVIVVAVDVSNNNSSVISGTLGPAAALSGL
jgi:Domain of unknown function (DUF4190)